MTIARATPLARPLTPDATTIAFATLVAVVMGVFLGFVPTWRALHANTSAALRQGRTVARPVARAERLALITQVALSMVLLIGAGLFARTLG